MTPFAHFSIGLFIGLALGIYLGTLWAGWNHDALTRAMALDYRDKLIDQAIEMQRRGVQKVRWLVGIRKARGLVNSRN